MVIIGFIRFFIGTRRWIRFSKDLIFLIPPQKMVIIGFIRFFIGTRRWIRFSKDLIFFIPSPENGDNWIYSVFYVSPVE